MNVSPFRLTPEDLAGLDKKTREGLQPLLEALNTTLGQVVGALAAIPPAWPTELTFTTEGTGAAYVSLTPELPGPVRSVAVDYLRRSDGTPIASPYSCTWSFTATGIRLLFVGLDAGTKYALGVTAK